MISFTLQETYKYEIGKEVPVYLDDRELISGATVKKIQKTGVWNRDKTVLTPHNQVYFELNTPFNDEKLYTPYFSGANGRICVIDKVKQKENRDNELKRKIRTISSMTMTFKYVCVSCCTVISTSKEFKSLKCKHCRQGQLHRVY